MLNNDFMHNEKVDSLINTMLFRWSQIQQINPNITLDDIYKYLLQIKWLKNVKSYNEMSEDILSITYQNIVEYLSAHATLAKDMDLEHLSNLLN